MLIYSYQLLFILIIISTDLTINTMNLVAIDFEVYGRVQGVFFRKYTQREANKLGLKGWCMNTSKGTVRGALEGDSSKVNEMKHWLQNVGSPQSKIDKVEFHNEKPVESFSYDSFQIRR